MTSEEIRNTFLDFFKDKNHHFMKSSPVYPAEDPTLMFTNAGMNQFKDIFLGERQPEYPRAVNYQKCMRVSGKHNDLSAVGRDTTHHTFFEMLGTWSFGNYYKKEAVEWAWELLTEVWKVNPENLYATVYTTDDEAEEIWKSRTSIDHSHISRFEEDNFWEMGETGPCGPCSEVHYDRGEQFSCGESCGVNCECGRFIEIWNLVFMESYREKDGSLKPLKKKNIDTGMGFERITAVLQKKESNYDTDLFQPIIKKTEILCGKKFKDNPVAFRAVADHIRAVVFTIADGITPSNEGRGYVVRRILRRAARFGRELGLTEPFMYRLVDTVIKMMEKPYPELPERASYIQDLLRSEEKQFLKTLDRGIGLFKKSVKDLTPGGILGGPEAFMLYDTYGFPFDLIEQMASEKGFGVDAEGFDKEMEKQKERARAASKFEFSDTDFSKWKIITEGDDSEFTGYEALDCNTEVRFYKEEKDSILLVTAKTPFYAESGGQTGDTGIVIWGDREFKVRDTVKVSGKTVHVLSGNSGGNHDIEKKCFLKVGAKQRSKKAANHTAAHLLHYALKKVLGEHVNQAGSYVSDSEVRFDFSHNSKLSPEQIKEIETTVTEAVVRDYPVKTEIMSSDEAVKSGAVALFGEKYGNTVRVVSAGSLSKELCGGTHAKATGNIGPFIIASEGSIASGVRRITALTGKNAYEFIRSKIDSAEKSASLLKTAPEEVPGKISEIQAEIKRLERENTSLQKDVFNSDFREKREKALIDIEGVDAAVLCLEDMPPKASKIFGDIVYDANSSGITLCAVITTDNKLSFFCAVSKDLTKRIKAGDIVKTAAAAAGGGGGGRPDRAQAGGRDISKSKEALEAGKEYISKCLG